MTMNAIEGVGPKVFSAIEAISSKGGKKIQQMKDAGGLFAPQKGVQVQPAFSAFNTGAAQNANYSALA